MVSWSVSTAKASFQAATQHSWLPGNVPDNDSKRPCRLDKWLFCSISIEVQKMSTENDFHLHSYQFFYFSWSRCSRVIPSSVIYILFKVYDFFVDSSKILKQSIITLVLTFLRFCMTSFPEIWRSATIKYFWNTVTSTIHGSNKLLKIATIDRCCCLF